MRDDAYVTSEAYVDYAGQTPRARWPRTYNEVIQYACPRCHAKPLELCTNPVRPRNRHQAKAPCLARLKQDWPQAEVA